MHAAIHYYTVAQREAELSGRKHHQRLEQPAKTQRENRPRGGLLAFLRLRRTAPALSSRAA
jgi:hypothetical protein